MSLFYCYLYFITDTFGLINIITLYAYLTFPSGCFKDLFSIGVLKFHDDVYRQVIFKNNSVGFLKLNISDFQQFWKFSATIFLTLLLPLLLFLSLPVYWNFLLYPPWLFCNSLISSFLLSHGIH